MHILFLRDDLIRKLDKKEDEMAIGNHNREMGQKMRETQRIDLSSSSNEESSSSDDELSFEKLSKIMIKEHGSPIRDTEEEVPIEEDLRQLAYKDFVSDDDFV